MDGNSHNIIAYSIAHNGQIKTYKVCDCHISYATPTPYNSGYIYTIYYISYLFVTFRVTLPHFKSGNNGIMEFAGVKPLVYKVQ